MATIVATTLLTFAVSGCGGGDGGEKTGDGKAPASQPAASPRQGDDPDEGGTPTSGESAKEDLAEVKGGGLTLTVTSAVRGQGGFVTVQGRVVNGSGEPWSAGEWRGDESELVKNGGSIAGASLVDNTGKKKYLVLRDTEGRCLCTRFTGGVGSGETVDWFAQFPAPPEGTTEVDFQVGSMPPAAIEISGGE
ncbi:hypothetical protein ACWD6I_14765 [Streptomyces sp. NPDC002454]